MCARMCNGSKPSGSRRMRHGHTRGRSHQLAVGGKGQAAAWPYHPLFHQPARRRVPSHQLGFVFDDECRQESSRWHKRHIEDEPPSGRRYERNIEQPFARCKTPDREMGVIALCGQFLAIRREGNEMKRLIRGIQQAHARSLCDVPYPDRVVRQDCGNKVIFRGATKPLHLERHVDFPNDLAGRRLAHHNTERKSSHGTRAAPGQQLSIGETAKPTTVQSSLPKRRVSPFPTRFQTKTLLPQSNAKAFPLGEKTGVLSSDG